MKKILILIFIGLSATFILSGCGSKSGSSSNDNSKTGKLVVKSIELK